MAEKTSHIGKLIVARRAELKLTQRALAAKMKVSFQFISNLEHARAFLPPNRIGAVCKALKLPVDAVSGAVVRDYEESVNKKIARGIRPVA